MTHEIKINIEEIIDLGSEYDKKGLLSHLIWDSISDDSHIEFLKYWLDDRMESEKEFDNRKELIKAYATIIESL